MANKAQLVGIKVRCLRGSWQYDAICWACWTNDFLVLDLFHQRWCTVGRTLQHVSASIPKPPGHVDHGLRTQWLRGVLLSAAIHTLSPCHVSDASGKPKCFILFKGLASNPLMLHLRESTWSASPRPSCKGEDDGHLSPGANPRHGPIGAGRRGEANTLTRILVAPTLDRFA